MKLFTIATRLLLIATTAGIWGCSQLTNVPTSEAGGFQTVSSADALDSGRFILFLPKGADNTTTPLPVLLFLHGMGENGENGLTQIHNNFGPQIARVQEFHPFIGVCVQTSQERIWRPGGLQMEQTIKILDSVLEQYNGDPDRVVLIGVSSGGRATLANAADIPERFAAAIPMAGPTEDENIPRLADSRIPIWFIFNGGDKSKGVVDGCRNNRRQLISLGHSPVFTEYQQTGHNSWDRGFTNPAVFAWALEQNRKKRQPPMRWTSGQELLSAAGPEFVKGWESDTDQPLKATASAQGVIVVPCVTENPVMHLDIWPSPGATTAIGLVGRENQQPLYTIELCDTDSGVGAIYDSQGNWIKDLDVVSLQHLVAGEWNDVRMDVHGTLLNVTVNGWKAVPVDLGATDESLQFALMPPVRGETAFRYVRYEISADMLPAKTEESP